MNNKKSSEIVIIGAGITGLSVAWRLSKKGYKVIVLEQQKFSGGLSTSIKEKGFKMDIGPHFLTLPLESDITNEIKTLVGDENLIKINNIHESYRAYFRGNLLTKYPSLYNIIFNSGIISFVNSIGSYLFASVFYRKLEKSNIEKYLISIYGKFLYNNWFKPYIVQNEGIGDTQQPKELVEKMFPKPSIKKIFKYILKNNSKKSSTITEIKNESLEYFDCYFRNGMGSIIESLENEIISNNGKILLGVNVQNIIHDDNLKKILYSKEGEEYEIECDKIIYSIPPSITLKWFENIPKNLTNQNKKLESFHSIIAFLMIDSPKIFDGWLIQVYDTDLVFFRITQQKYLSEHIAPNNKSLLCVEIKCTENDNIWKMDKSEIFSRIKTDLSKMKILSHNEIFDHKILKLNNIYPIAQQTANLNNNEITKFINSFKNEFAVTTTSIDSGRLVSGTKKESDAKNMPRLGGLYDALQNSKILASKIIDDGQY
jgi:protoporphyrinogen oxidase